LRALFAVGFDERRGSSRFFTMVVVSERSSTVEDVPPSVIRREVVVVLLLAVVAAVSGLVFPTLVFLGLPLGFSATSSHLSGTSSEMHREQGRAPLQALWSFLQRKQALLTLTMPAFLFMAGCICTSRSE